MTEAFERPFGQPALSPSATEPLRVSSLTGNDQAQGGAYYNEIDPFAAAWLRELIAAGHIAPGIVDERDIRDVRPDELAQFTQCHFFAGIGVWSYALRRAGWPDDRPIWTASLPCQPWSDAGAGGGFDDERHLWPSFNELRLALRPIVCIGEQVASKAGLAWLDAVQADVEASGDAFGAVDLCSAGFGAPHIRQRLHWLAHADDHGRRQYGNGLDRASCSGEGSAGEWEQLRADPANDGAALRLAHPASGGQPEQWDALGPGYRGYDDGGVVARWLADTDGRNASAERQQRSGEQRQLAVDGVALRLEHADRDQSAEIPGNTGEVRSLPEAQRQPEHGADVSLRGSRDGGPAPTNGFWRDADWLFCTDGKWRPVEPGTFPLAHGAPARVGRLRGYGNAINAEVATAFIEAVIDHLDGTPLEAAA